MSKVLYIDNYIIEEPLINIIYTIKNILGGSKLKDIIEKKDELVVTCPNDDHDGGQEKNPDCHINLRDDRDVPYGCTNCFACGDSGMFVHFVAKCFSKSYAYAKQWLIKNYGIQTSLAVKLDDDISLAKNDKKYLSKSILDGLQDWTPYLAERHLDRAICEKFHVKYDPVHRQVVFPVYDINNNLLMAPRRNIDNKFFILNSDTDKSLYGLNLIIKNNIGTIVWCEGPIDCLTYWSHGIPAICSFGTPSEEQIEQVNKSCVRKVFLGCDNDAAGRKFNREIASKLSDRIFTQEITYPLNCKDINDLNETQMKNLIEKYNLYKIF